MGVGVFVVYVYLFMESQINVDMCIMQYFPSLYQCSLIYFCYFMDLRLSTIDIINTMHTQCNQHNDADSFL